jgi:hypothetical protein
MPTFRKTVVEDIVAGLGLEAANRAFADYWLSLWEGDALPRRAAFSPARMKPFLPSILIFDVVPDEGVTVKLAGTGYRYVLQTDPTGKDWLEAAPESHRATRLRAFSAVARGAILVAHRRVAMLGGGEHVSEEILLPFAEEQGGHIPVLAHVNFRPDQFSRIKSVAQVTGDALDVKLVPLNGRPG